MRRFLLFVIALLLLGVGIYSAVFLGGFYWKSPSDQPLSLPFRTEGRTLLRQGEDGSYHPLTLRGIDVSASMPGHYATQYAPEEADYLRWLESIGALGANTVRVTTVMDDDFYNALWSYNTTHPQPLYLLQGTSVSDFAADGPQDAYAEDFQAQLIRAGRNLVDIIHGRKDIRANDLRGSGRYRKDISPWVVGFLVGTEWSPDTIAYTDHNSIRTNQYHGVYFSTTDEATPFEAMLAQVMDEIAAYETDKYAAQRPLSFISDPNCDFLEYEMIYARQLPKYAWLDAEHIRPTQALQSGYFAAYRLYDFCEDFSRYLSTAQRGALAPLLSGLDTDAVYGGYLELLSRYHSMPVVAAGYGFSTTRGAVKMGLAPLTEQEQGLRLAEVSAALEDAAWSGGFVSTWQDVWERRTWNTAFATVPTQNHLWHDLQTEGQGYGLMAFEPGEEARVCVVDGDPGEWGEDDVNLSSGGLTLSVRQDVEGLFLLIQGEGLSPDEPLYLPIDLSPEVGSARCAAPALTFDRAADFLLCLAGPEESRLLVHERYNATRQNFHFETTGRDPFLSVPEADSAAFVPITLALRNPLLLDTLTPITRVRQRMGLWETGRLVHGNADPDAPDYNSLADFRYGADCVEVRLPWLLLNVADPSSRLVHRDYYPHYGMETQPITKLFLGLGGGEEEITLRPASLRGWRLGVECRERLKESYQVLQAQWKGGAGDAAAS